MLQTICGEQAYPGRAAYCQEGDYKGVYVSCLNSGAPDAEAMSIKPFSKAHAKFTYTTNGVTHIAYGLRIACTATEHKVDQALVYKEDEWLWVAIDFDTIKDINHEASPFEYH